MGGRQWRADRQHELRRAGRPDAAPDAGGGLSEKYGADRSRRKCRREKPPPLYPAADPDVIAVTATDSEDHYDKANHGAYIALAAPGVEILVDAPGTAYQITTGTSVAAAHVSGIAALLLEHKPSLTPSDVRAILMATARTLGTADQSAEFGAGLADAYRALMNSSDMSAKPADVQAKK